MKKKIIFICTHNSVRSQMAEGILRHIAGDSVESFSAGMIKTDVNPMAIKVMEEKGIDISGQYSKTLDELEGIEFDIVITVCDSANKNCPNLPGNYKKLHWSIEDPGTFPGTDEEKLNAFRDTRDLLFGMIQSLVEEEI